MSIAVLVAKFGLLAVGIGAAIEGETVVMTGGLLAHQGLLPIRGVMAAAAIGSFVADQAFFFLGRHFRSHRRIVALTSKPGFARALTLLERYPNGFILAFRFFYGFRTISPIAIGASEISARRFVLLNGLAAAGWGVLIAGIGYTFGQAVQLAFGRLHHFTHIAMAVAALAVAAFAVIMGVRHFVRATFKAKD